MGLDEISYLLALILVTIWAFIYLRYKTKDHHYYLLLAVALVMILMHAYTHWGVYQRW